VAKLTGMETRAVDRGERMLLNEQITQSLAALKGMVSNVPKTVGWSAGGGPAFEVDFTAVDSLGCTFRELRLSADELKTVPFERLKAWADNLCQKVTYLLENVAPLELDTGAQTVLIRSVPPTRDADQTAFYEMVVKAPGELSLRRYIRAARAGNRESRDIQITHEVLVRLVHDIVAAIPAAQ